MKESLLKRYVSLETSRKIFCCAFFCAGVLATLLLIPFLQDSFLNFAQNVLLKRNIRNIQKWHFLFNLTGLILPIMCLLYAFAIFNKADEKFSFVFETYASKIAVTLIVVYSAFAIFCCFLSNGFWYDEAFSISLCTHPFLEIISLTAKDVHPPLYYLILKIFMVLFRNSVYAARIVSLIPVIIFMIVAFRFLTKEFSAKVAAIFELLVFSSANFFKYCLEIRMYSWSALFIGLCAIYSYFIIKREKMSDWILYVVFALCTAYTQYFSAVIVLCNFVPLCIYKFVKSKKNLKYILVSCFFGVVFYLPWIPVVLSQFSEVSGSYWISPVNFERIIFCLKILSPGYSILGYFGLLFMAALLCIFIFCKNQKEKSFWNILCIASPFAQIAIGLILSVIVRPIFVERYALPAIFMIMVAASIIIWKIKDTKLFLLIIASFVLFSFATLLGNIREERKSGFDFKEFTQKVAKNVGSNTKFVFVENENFNFSGHQRGIFATLFPNHKFYSSVEKGIRYDYKWAFLFNSEFLPLEELEFDSTLCIAMENSTPATVQDEFIARILNDKNWKEKPFSLVTPDLYEKYRVYFFKKTL